jgi:general stress protein YciG
MADNNTSNRGLANADEQTRKEVASKGGQASGGNPQNLTDAARAKGGRRSHSGGRSSS